MFNFNNAWHDVLNRSHMLFYFVGLTGNTSKVLFPAIWAFLTLLIIGLTLLVVYFHNRQKKRGQYNFVPVCQMSNIAI